MSEGKEMGSTNMLLEGGGVELELYQFGGVEHQPQHGKELAGFVIARDSSPRGA